jgi:multidrug resistance efflux pump
MKRLYALCAALAAVLAALTFYYRAEPDTFYGIADTKEIAVSSESPVEIRRIAVVQGQLVAQGDTLLELYNPDLEMRLSQITHELSELQTRKAAHATLSRSEILQFKAQREERVSGIRAQIKELEAQYDLNRKLVSELRSLDRDKAAAKPDGDAGNPILVKLESLRKLEQLAEDPKGVYEHRLVDALSSSGDPLVEQVRRMEDELRLLTEDRKRLVIQAQIGGLVGSVNFKVGEKVSPFTPILTVHAASPSFVRGYIHENVYSKVAVGQKVRVQSNQDPRHRVDGEVVGVGARIVEYPERLRKRPDILIWGREIMVKLPQDNRFLLGEKVLISSVGGAARPAGSPSEPPSGTPDVPTVNAGNAGVTPSAAPVTSAAHAAPESPATAAGTASRPVVKDTDYHDLRAPAPSAAGIGGTAEEVPGIEASGLIYLPDLGSYLVISDETRKKSAEVFLMDTAFRIEKPVPIRGLDKMDDMESIADGGNGTVFVLSSQSLSKKGKRSEARKRLAKARRSGEALELERSIVLLDVLERAAGENAGKDWAAYLMKGLKEGSTDIEGMALRDGNLYLGFKAPLLDGKAVILRIDGVDALMSGKTPASEAVSIWKAMDLKSAAGSVPCGIADLIFLDGDAYFLSSSDDLKEGVSADGRHAGELWALRDGAAKPERLKDFEGAKPEGLAPDPAGGGFIIAFDNGSKRPSQVRRIVVRP